MDYKYIKGPLSKVNIDLLTKAGLLGEDMLTLTFDPKISSSLIEYCIADAYITRIRSEETEPLDQEHNQEAKNSYLIYVEVHRPRNEKKEERGMSRVDLYLRKLQLRPEEVNIETSFKPLARETIRRKNRIYIQDLESRLDKLTSK